MKNYLSLSARYTRLQFWIGFIIVSALCTAIPHVVMQNLTPGIQNAYIILGVMILYPILLTPIYINRLNDAGLSRLLWWIAFAAQLSWIWLGITVFKDLEAAAAAANVPHENAVSYGLVGTISLIGWLYWVVLTFICGCAKNKAK